MPFINPILKCRCPYCHTEFYPGQCAIVRFKDGVVLHPANTSLAARSWLRSIGGEENLRYQVVRQCPNPNCGRALPHNIGLVDNLTIAIVGDTYAGKSHYIAASIHQLREGKMTQIDRYARFIRLNPEIEEQYLQKFFNPLFKQKQQLPGNLPATSPINDPLIYEMVFEGAINPGRIKHLNMLIYDAAGGDLANQDVMVDVARFVLNADALIFLADPMSMEGIVEQLPFHLRNNPTSGRRASDVLNWVIQTLERARNLEAGARLPIPIAITISKSDLLKYVRGARQQYRFLYNPRYYGVVDLADVYAVDAEIRDLIANFGDTTLLQAAKRFDNVNFFATSATGWPPNADGTYPAIVPQRCLDPLLWVLWKLKVVEAV